MNARHALSFPHRSNHPKQAGGRLPPDGGAAHQHHREDHLLLLRRRGAQAQGQLVGCRVYVSTALVLAVTHTLTPTQRFLHAQLFGRFRPPLRLGLLPYKMQGIQRTANIITQADAEVFGLK